MNGGLSYNGRQSKLAVDDRASKKVAIFLCAHAKFAKTFKGTMTAHS